jgi:hypothetical protein
MKKYFLTFGGGGKNYIDATIRLSNQINKLELFDSIIIKTDKDLQQDSEFWNKHGNFISNNKRGYGYWLWKPYIILKTMEQMEDGDILLYLDCGCEVDYRKKKEFLSLFDQVKKDYIIGTHGLHPGWFEREWNKKDLLIHMDMLNNDIINSVHRQGGTNMFLKSDKTFNLVKEWYQIACSDNYHYIDDSPSREPNLPSFKEHRHDQSIFSLLTKKYNLYSETTDLESIISVYRNISGHSRIR